MLDIKLIREQPGAVEENLRRRNDPQLLEMLHRLMAKDKDRLAKLKQAEELRRRRNEITREITAAKKEGKTADALMAEASKIPDAIKRIEDELEKLSVQCNDLLMRIPNLLHESVPEGKSDADNVEIKRFGRPPQFSFKPKSHVEVLEALGLLDADRAAKASGHGFFYVKGKLALLDYALQRYALDFLAGRKFTIVEPPFMLLRKPYEGVTSLEDFENVMYKIDGDDLYLIATSEHSLGAMMMDETLLKEQLPLRFAGVSPCFRKEVGAHGKYTKGLFRMHQFNKVEQFVFALPEESWRLHEEIQKNSEALLQGLELHYRVVNVCTGDMGSIAAKKYDTEIWMSDNEFREVGSNSNCTDYQARRLNVKWREGEGKPPAGVVHTLNNTAIATSRVMIALIEQHQQGDNTVAIPKALQKYCGFKVLE